MKDKQTDYQSSIILNQLKKRKKNSSPSTHMQTESKLELRSPERKQKKYAKLNGDANERIYGDQTVFVATSTYNVIYRWFRIISVVAIIAIIAFMHMLLQISITENGYFDTCTITREERPKTQKLLFKTATILILLCFGITWYNEHCRTVNRNGNSLIKNNSLYLLVYMASWYHVSWGFVVFLKRYLNDVTCNIHENSVSGHYHFFVFSILTIPFVFFFMKHQVYSIRENEQGLRIREISFYVLYALLFIISMFSMLETYQNGYHSLRQILYGTILAVVSHFLFINVVLHGYEPENRTKTALVLVFLFLIMLYCNFLTNSLSEVWLYNIIGVISTYALAYINSDYFSEMAIPGNKI